VNFAQAFRCLAFSTLTPLVGHQEDNLALSNVMLVWLSVWSEVQYAYNPADATATASSLVLLKSRMVYLSGAGLPRLSWKKRGR